MYEARLPPVSNRGAWAESVEVASADDGSLLDLAGCTITIELRRHTPRGRAAVDRADLGGSDTALTASTSDGKITLPSTGVFQWRFGRSEMQALAPGVYELGCVIASPDDPDGDVQLFIGTVPIIDGVVS